MPIQRAADRSAVPPGVAGQVLVDTLRSLVGRRHVMTSASSMQQFARGFRTGGGAALAVVKPGSLAEQWRVLQACVAADVIVIMQAANTGLTGGSTPDGDDYDRHIVIINTLRIAGIQVIDQGRQVICLPGSTLDQLEKQLRPMGREPHSVIGSSCIGASVMGGVCNNSGGSLVQRGPAFTEMALFAQRDEKGQLHLVNHLGVNLGDDPEQICARLDRGDYDDSDIDPAAGRGSDHSYAEHVRDIDADTPARFNADPRCLHEASGSAGRLAVFAVRLDTFPTQANARVFYIGTNVADELTAIRRSILGEFSHLPIAGEYMHRDAFDIAEIYGKDVFLFIEKLGTAKLPRMYALKARADALLERIGVLPSHLSDRMMQAMSRWFPAHLPPRIKEYRDRFENHLILKVAAEDVAETEAFLQRFFAEASGDYFVCDVDEGRKAFLHRFVTAGAAVRYRAVHPQQVEDIVALDIALRRNDRHWQEHLPADINESMVTKLYYGHFLCHVMHQDYIVRKGRDCHAIEHRMHELLDQRGAQYPAEHNVGHLYQAKPSLVTFYRQLDPMNSFNPGIGKTTTRKQWAE